MVSAEFREHMHSSTISEVDLARQADETLALRRERDELRQRHHALQHAAEQGWEAVGASGGSADAAEAAEAADTPHPPVGPESVREMLEAVDAHLKACVANAVFSANPTPAEQEMLRVREKERTRGKHVRGIERQEGKNE